MTPEIRVGLSEGPRVEVRFHGNWGPDTPENITIEADGEAHPALDFTPAASDAAFTVAGMTLGIGFHWERREDMTFGGRLRLLRLPDRVVAINIIDIESYLRSVISSEMRATAMPALLEAHAVISRSWLVRNLERRGRPTLPVDTAREHIIWYDREAHSLYDVCADDHCQRYQGLTRITRPAAARAVEATHGLVLAEPGGGVVDARFSKCCGGAMETFGSCWSAEEAHPCLQPGRDADAALLPDLRDEATARAWTRSSPRAWCNTADAEALDQVLNSYDRETPDFYRWRVHYGADELAGLLRRRSGRDFGRVKALVAEERGASGRITRLRIEGERLTLTFGKELEIRRWLSESHLYSSAFSVDAHADGSFTLHGAGWGHGVGLCQVGAAMMAVRGLDSGHILRHYYPGARLEKRW